MATPRIHLTHHAFERYRSRWAPDVSVADARAELVEIAQGARPIKARSLLGHEMWANGDVRLVVKRDGDGCLPVCVTVLEPPLPADPEMFEDAFGAPLARTSELLEAVEAHRAALQHTRDLQAFCGEMKAHLAAAIAAQEKTREALAGAQRLAHGGSRR